MRVVVGHRARGALVSGLATLALVVVGLGGVTSPTSAQEPPTAPPAAGASTTPPGYTDAVAIGGITEPVGVAFAGDGTAFVALKTGVVKSFDYGAAAGTFEPGATATDFADLSVEVDNYGDRGLTGITVDPQFPVRPYVYVNYTLNADPRDDPLVIPKWGTPGEQYDDCPAEASISDPVVTGCPVMVRVSRLTAERTTYGWTMVAGSEKPLVTSGCFQFSSHSSGDVVFGPDGKLYASAGDGASYLGQDYGQANNPCGDPADEGGSLRAQDVRGTGAHDPLGINGTVFRLDPDVRLAPSQNTAGQWLVAYGQRNPWRLTFRPGTSDLWSVDVGSSNWEEINRMPAAPSASVVNRGWPCYEGTTGTPLVNAAWDALDKPLCENLYPNGLNEVQAPVYSYRTRTGAGPLTAGENCPVTSSSISGVAFPTAAGWPAADRDALYFSDFLRGCIWKLGRLANGDPDPSSVTVFAQQVGAPVQVLTGPGGDLFYVDYGLDADGVVTGGGSVHRISYLAPAPVPAPTTQLTVKVKHAKLKVKVDGKRHKTPYTVTLAPGSVVKVVAPRTQTKKGVRYVFRKWKDGGSRKRTVTVGAAPVVLKAVYRRVRL